MKLGAESHSAVSESMKAKIVFHWFVRAVLTATVMGILPGALSSAAGQAAPVEASVKVAPLKYRQRTLANGLTFLSIENHRSPTVAIQVWYHVGGKDDPAGRSGFAHLFEHIMFKATKNQKSIDGLPAFISDARH